MRIKNELVFTPCVSKNHDPTTTNRYFSKVNQIAGALKKFESASSIKNEEKRLNFNKYF